MVTGSNIHRALNRIVESAQRLNPIRGGGYVLRALGQTIEAELPNGFIGEICELHTDDGNIVGRAEIIGINGNKAILSSFGTLHRLSERSLVVPTGQTLTFPVGEQLLGRVVNAWGLPLDGVKIESTEFKPIFAEPPNPMKRDLVEKHFQTGIVAIDALTTIGRGQRVGVIGPAGSGKSQMMAKIIAEGDFDVAIVGLIGERGREVRDFVEKSIPEKLRKKVSTIVATADCSALERVHAAHAATTLAEWFRDRGYNVLLIIDSITRFTRALREVGLAAGEPPTRRGFPSSVFAELPRLFERGGMNEFGSITSIYTLLVESDRDEDPIAEETRSLLDGHIILSGSLASSGRFPAIDILKSHSRLISRLVSKQHLSAANKVRELIDKYNELELLLQVGEYQRGRDSFADLAIDKHKEIEQFCRSYYNVQAGLSSLERTLGELAK